MMRTDLLFNGLQEAKKRSEEQTKAEEANMQDVATQVQKLMAEIEARALAKKDEVGRRLIVRSSYLTISGTAEGRVHFRQGDDEGDAVGVM
jgi:hypothetical protein